MGYVKTKSDSIAHLFKFLEDYGINTNELEGGAHLVLVDLILRKDHLNSSTKDLDLPLPNHN